MARWWIPEYPFRAGSDDVYLHHVIDEGTQLAQKMSFSQAATYVLQRAIDTDRITTEFIGRERKQFTGQSWRRLCKLLGLGMEPHTDIQPRQRGGSIFQRIYRDAGALSDLQAVSDFYKIEVEYAGADSVGDDIWWPAHWDVTIYSYGSGELHGYSEKSLADAIQNAQKEAKAKGGT